MYFLLFHYYVKFIAYLNIIIVIIIGYPLLK